MANVTKPMLELAAGRLNRLTESPAQYMRDGVIQPGCYHIDSQKGGWQRARNTQTGGDDDVLRTGHISKGRLYELIHAYIAGYEACKADTKKEDAPLSTVVTSLRLPVDLVTRIEALAKIANTSRNAMVNHMLVVGFEETTKEDEI